MFGCDPNSFWVVFETQYQAKCRTEWLSTRLDSRWLLMVPVCACWWLLVAEKSGMICRSMTHVCKCLFIFGTMALGVTIRSRIGGGR